MSRESGTVTPTALVFAATGLGLLVAGLAYVLQHLGVLELEFTETSFWLLVAAVATPIVLVAEHKRTGRMRAVRAAEVQRRSGGLLFRRRVSAVPWRSIR